MNTHQLISQLAHEQASIRQEAVALCARQHDLLHGTAVRDALIRLLADEDATIRRYAVMALGHIRDERSAEAIAQQLRDHTPAVRRRVCAFLIKYPHSAGIVAPLLAIVQDTTIDYAGRDFAAMTLASGGHDEARPTLIALLGQEDARPIYRRLVHCMIRMPHPDALPALKCIQADDTLDAVTRKVAGRAIQRIESPDLPTSPTEDETYDDT